MRRERAAALYNQVRTKTQEQVNTLVINHLSDGVLVVDSSLQVVQANPAALRLLGLPELHAQNFSLQTQPWWQPLTEVVQTTFSHARPLSVTVHLQANEQGTTTAWMYAPGDRGRDLLPEQRPRPIGQPFTVRDVSARSARDGSPDAHRKTGLHGAHVGRRGP